MRLWGGRFGEPNDPRVVDFGRSIDVDAALAEDDIGGSIAHVHGLERAGILGADDAFACASALRKAQGAHVSAHRLARAARRLFADGQRDDGSAH